MIFVWFIYGLAFFVLGLAILVYPKKNSAFALAKDIWMVAVFGIIHGINEWIDMFIGIGEPFPLDILKFLRMITLSVSFLFLLRFGIKIIAEDKKSYRYLRTLPFVLFGIWLAIFIFHPQHFLMGDICGRYLLCLPGSALTAVALLLQASQFKKMKLRSITWNLYLSAITFFLYAVFAGAIVKKAPFLTANFLNYDTFISVFGAPVQIFRAVCAVVLAYSTTQILSIFRWETRENLRKSEQRCSMITEGAPIILFVLDKASIITFIQGRGLNLLNLKAKDMIGKPLTDIFPSVTGILENAERALSGEDFVATVTIDKIVFECGCSPMRDDQGDITGVIGVALDVTERMSAQKELDNYRRKMEKNARLAEIGTMASTMARQIDGPLAVSRLLLQRIQSSIATQTTDQTIIDSLKRGLMEISKARELVEKFHSIVQVSPKSNAGPVDLYQIARRMMDVYAKSAQQSNLTIAIRDIDIMPQMTISNHELEQIFFVMIQNAINAADPEKKQKLTISCDVSYDHIELRFADTCGGIEPERLGHIFEPFFSANRQNRGAGLGLVIAKQIVNSYGGNLEVKSQLGQGTKFYVKLPIERID